MFNIVTLSWTSGTMRGVFYNTFALVTSQNVCFVKGEDIILE